MVTCFTTFTFLTFSNTCLHFFVELGLNLFVHVVVPVLGTVLYTVRHSIFDTIVGKPQHYERSRNRKTRIHYYFITYETVSLQESIVQKNPLFRADLATSDLTYDQQNATVYCAVNMFNVDFFCGHKKYVPILDILSRHVVPQRK